jgi:hypothetical protein
LAGALVLNLTGEELRKLAKTLHPENIEGYQAYLRGRYYSNKRTADGIGKAMGEFQQAIDRDPNYHGEFVVIPSGAGAGVARHSQIVKDQAHVARQLSHFLCNAAYAFGLDDCSSEAAKPGDIFRTVTGPDSTAVLVIVPIEDVVAAVLDVPVLAVDPQQASLSVNSPRN